VKLTAQEFRDWEHRAITFLGMSGVGKTRLARILRISNWFHYSVDYRIGTRYLDEQILDNIKNQAMSVPFLRELLRQDSIHIANNLTIDNLQSLSTFVSKIGNPELGGLGITEFLRRQSSHRDAEIASLNDVPEYIDKARRIYGYDHFVNDAGGSLCELEDEQVLDKLSEHTMIIYFKATEKDEEELIHRAESSPKPLYYREAFLQEQLEIYMADNSLDYVALIDPDDFCRWVFPRLFHARVPRYEAITEKYGYSISTSDITSVTDEKDFISLVEATLESQE
jgi:hypothetical protein